MFLIVAIMFKLILLCVLVAVVGGAEPPVKYVVSIWRVGAASTTPTVGTTTPTVGTTTPTVGTTTPTIGTTTPSDRAEPTTTGHQTEQRTPVCTGAMVGEDYVLTTEQCLFASATPMGVHITAGVGDLSVENITSYFHVASEVIRNSPFVLLKVDKSFTQDAVKWRTSTTAVGSSCSFTYFNTRIMRQHPFATLHTVACPDDQLGTRICAQKPDTEASSKLCNVGAEGAVLVCGGELAGMWGGNYGCQSFFFNEVQQKKDWLAEYVHNGASPTTSALFGVVTIVLTVCFH